MLILDPVTDAELLADKKLIEAMQARLEQRSRLQKMQKRASRAIRRTLSLIMDLRAKAFVRSFDQTDEKAITPRFVEEAIIQTGRTAGKTARLWAIPDAWGTNEITRWIIDVSELPPFTNESHYAFTAHAEAREKFEELTRMEIAPVLVETGLDDYGLEVDLWEYSAILWIVNVGDSVDGYIEADYAYTTEAEAREKFKELTEARGEEL